MSPIAPDDLSILEGQPEAAFLWDGERARIVWANRAGLAFWGETSLIDLIDRRFPPDSETVRRIAEIGRELAGGATRRERLVLHPRTGETIVEAECRLMALYGGRAGLLTVFLAEADPHAGEDIRARLLSAVIDALPWPVAVFDQHGSLVLANAPARDLTEGVAVGEGSVLAAWLGDEARARDLISAGLALGGASETETVTTRFGRRAHRVAVRRIAAPVHGRTALVFAFDDIEDRRAAENRRETLIEALERQLAAVALPAEPAPVPQTEPPSPQVEPPAPAAELPPVQAEEPPPAAGSLPATGSPPAVKAGRSAAAGKDDAATFSAIARAIAAHADAKAHDSLPAADAAQREARAIEESARASALRVVGGVDHDERDHSALAPRSIDGDALEHLDEPALVHRAFTVLGSNDRFAAMVGEPRPGPGLPNANLLNLFAEDRPRLFSLQGQFDDGAILEPGEVGMIPLRAAGGLRGAPALLARIERVLYEGEPAMLMRFEETQRAREAAGAAQVPAQSPGQPLGQSVGQSLAQAPAQSPSPAPPHGPSHGPSPAERLGTEREAELRAIINAAADGIATLEADGRIRTFNASAEAIFGRNAIDVAGQKLSVLLDAESARTVDAYLQSVGEGTVPGLNREGREVTGRRADGSAVPLFLTLGPMKVEGTPAFCAVIRDITQWKQSETALRRARDQAEQASTKKSDFLARMSHELRTPLNAIIGFSEVMSEEKFGPIANDRYKGYLTDIRSSGEHLLSLINDLLDMSKIEAGKLELNFVSVALGPLIRQSVQLMQPQATHERIIMRVSLPEDMPPVVADERALRQILLNLLSNAIKFTPPGGQVILSTVLDETGRVQVRIRDTGAGMSAKDLEAAMEPFRQVNVASAKSSVSGTGLGLPLTKALAEANRAEFRIESTPGAGTLVQVIFPPERVLAG